MKLLEHFHKLSIYPKNAKELKGLILQLAIQGKLTADWRLTNPDVEPAAVLLERIKAEKKELIKAKKIKKEKALPEIEVDEIPFELPSSWVWCRFGSLNANIHYGYTASADKNNKGVRLLRITDIQNNKVNWETVPGCKILEKDVFKYLLSENDILIARTGGTIGKSYQVKGVNVESVFASYLIRAIPQKNVCPEYLKSYIETPLYWAQLYAKSKGTGQPNVNATSLKELKTPLPPIQEQKAIVKVVDTLLQEVTQLEQLTQQRLQLKEKYVTAALNQVCEENTAKAWADLKEQFSTFFNEEGNIKQLRETILQLAVQGKLTANWRLTNPDVESAAVLLERIKAEKQALIKAKKIKKEKALPAIEADEVPYALPEGWVWCRLGEIVSIKGGKRVPKGYSLVDSPTKHIYIRVTDMKKGTVLLNKLKYITEEVYEKIKNYTISRYDLYITIAGTIGNVGEIPEVLDNMNLTENAAKIIFKQLDKRFLKTMLNSNICQRQFLGNVNQMAQPKLALKRIQRTLILLPPLQEQKAIVEKVNQLMDFCDTLEEEVIKSKETAEELMQVVLKEVFEGKVVEQVCK